MYFGKSHYRSYREETIAYTRCQRLAEVEEEFLKHRSKTHWLDVGDGNNKFFHNAVKTREMRNAIKEIRCGAGSIARTDEEIKVEAVRFFEEFMSTQPLEFEGATVERLQELLDFKCSEEDCRLLEREVTKEEIKGFLFKMPGDKSPGPDGFTSEFFKSHGQ